MGKTNDKARELKDRLELLVSMGVPVTFEVNAVLTGAHWVLEELLGDDIYDPERGSFDSQLETLEREASRHIREVNGL